MQGGAHAAPLHPPAPFLLCIMGNLTPCLRCPFGHIHSMLPPGRLAKRDLAAYCCAKIACILHAIFRSPRRPGLRPGGFSRFSGGHALHHSVGFALLVIASKVDLFLYISLRPRESGLAARASPSAVAVDFPEASLTLSVATLPLPLLALRHSVRLMPYS